MPYSCRQINGHLSSSDAFAWGAGNGIGLVLVSVAGKVNILYNHLRCQALPFKAYLCWEPAASGVVCLGPEKDFGISIFSMRVKPGPEGTLGMVHLILKAPSKPPA